MNMSDAQNKKENAGTEQKALMEEKRHKEWQRKYGEKLPILIDKMDRLLADASMNAILELKSIFINKDILENYKQVDSFANMYVIASIFEIEAERGIQQTILSQGQTVGELLNYLFQLKLLLYRLDFGIGENIEQEFISFIILHHTSTVNIEIMMTTSVIRPVITALKLEKIFNKFCIKEFDFSILMFIEKQWRGNLRVQKRLLSEYEHLLDEETAQKYKKNLEKIATENTDEKVVLELQELMWKIQYVESEIEQEIANYLKEHIIPDELWTVLLECADIQQVDFYLQITDELLEANLQKKAKITLRYARSLKPGDELVLCLLAESYMREGRLAEALCYLQEVKDPTSLTQQLQNACYRLEKKDDNK